MITGFFLNIIYTIIAFFVGLLPTIAIPTAWLDSVTLVMTYVNALSWLFPVATLLTVVSFAVAFHLAMLGYDLSLKAYHMLRGK